MKKKICHGCGAQLDEDMKICPYCGRLVSSSSQQENRSANSRRAAVSNGNVRQNQRRNLQRTSYSNAPQRQARNPQQPVSQTSQKPLSKRKQKKLQKQQRRYERDEKRQNRAIILRRIGKIAAVAVVIAAIYLVIFFVQVFRVRLSSYDFESEMTMSKDNYGEAISDYFEDGSWSVNPFTGSCTYKGTSKHDEEYEIVFSVKLKVEVKSITIDGEEVDDDAVEIKMMGMFI